MNITIDYYDGINEDLYSLILGFLPEEQQELFSNLVCTSSSVCHQIHGANEVHIFMNLKIRVAALCTVLREALGQEVTVRVHGAPVHDWLTGKVEFTG